MYPVIKEIMERKRMSLRELAKATGIRYQTLSQKLLGKNPILFKDAVAIKKALGVRTPLEVLFTEELTEKKEASV